MRRGLPKLGSSRKCEGGNTAAILRIPVIAYQGSTFHCQRATIWNDKDAGMAQKPLSADRYPVLLAMTVRHMDSYPTSGGWIRIVETHCGKYLVDCGSKQSLSALPVLLVVCDFAILQSTDFAQASAVQIIRRSDRTQRIKIVILSNQGIQWTGTPFRQVSSNL